MRHKPNILILMTDQQRADSMGCAGNPIIRTPNLDNIANEGVRFDSTYTVSPVCMPARASFISGLYPHNHNMWENAGKLPKDDETFFHHLQKQGYCTAHIGKSHYYSHSSGEHLSEHEDYMHARGLDYVHETTGPWAALRTESYLTDYWKSKGLLKPFRDDYIKRFKMRGYPEGPEKTDKCPVWPSPLPEEDFLDSYIGRKAVEFIGSYQDNSPLCMFVGFGAPHEPWDAPGRYASMYDPDSIPAPIPPGSTGKWVPQRVLDRMKTERIAEKIPAKQIRKAAAHYYGKISLVDHWVGQIVSAFEELRGPEKTLIVFWSDHGEMLGDHQCLYKKVFFESSVRVPLIIRWPSQVQKGRVCKSLVEIIDVYPTLLEVTGAAPSEQCFGKSLWPLLLDPQRKHRPAVFSEVSFFGHHNTMIRTSRHKYAVDETGMGYLLYDLTEDPSEQNNLIGHPKTVQTEQNLRDGLLAFLTDKQLRMDKHPEDSWFKENS